MGIISLDNENLFKDSKILFSKVKRVLSSYNAANLLDEGEFPVYVKEVLRDLGIGVYRENDAVLRVCNYKAKLPKGFSKLYSAYKCTPHFNTKDALHQQGQAISVFNDITWELIEKSKDCEIECCENNSIIEKIIVKQFVEEKAVITSLTNPILLRLSPNVKKSKCVDDCANLMASSPYEISLDESFIITNFNNDCIYLKYYEFPLDEDGMPQIPDIHDVEKTIEMYIIYQILLKLWTNNEVPDLQNRWQYYEQKYNEYFKAAKFYLRLPSFSQMVNNVRRQRSSNLVMYLNNKTHF